MKAFTILTNITGAILSLAIFALMVCLCIHLVKKFNTWRKAKKTGTPAPTTPKISEAEKRALEGERANKLSEKAAKERELHFLKDDKKSLEKTAADAADASNNAISARNSAHSKYKTSASKVTDAEIAEAAAAPADLAAAQAALATAKAEASADLAELQNAIAEANGRKAIAEAAANAVAAKQAEIEACETAIRDLTLEITDIEVKLGI